MDKWNAHNEMSFHIKLILWAFHTAKKQKLLQHSVIVTGEPVLIFGSHTENRRQFPVPAIL
jgi:hypothetical protein